MEAQKRFVKLSVDNEVLGVHYDYKHFFTSTCTESYSKYLCLSLDDAFVAHFTMEIFDTSYGTDRCSFQFYDGPYKGRWLADIGGYLYVRSQYTNLVGVFSDDRSSVKLWTNHNETKYWFKRGNKYKNDYCGDYYYVDTTTNESEALSFSITDISSGLLDPRDVRQNPLKKAQNPPKKAYFFKGNQYIQYDIAAGKVDEGYPKPIAGNWPGLEVFTDSIDAAVHWDNEKIYVFKGSQYICYDAPTSQIDSDYPRPIGGGENWTGVEPFANGIDAALTNIDKGKAYLFKGKQYIRYDLAANKADPGYPKPIAGNWPGAFTYDIDATVNLGDGKVYFFRGNQYIRYDLAADKADPGYPKPIQGNWAGLDDFADGIDAATAF